MKKKDYKAPYVEAVKFEYKDQVVAASGQCEYEFRHDVHACGETPVFKTTQCMI